MPDPVLDAGDIEVLRIMQQSCERTLVAIEERIRRLEDARASDALNHARTHAALLRQMGDAGEREPAPAKAGDYHEDFIDFIDED